MMILIRERRRKTPNLWIITFPTRKNLYSLDHISSRTGCWNVARIPTRVPNNGPCYEQHSEWKGQKTQKRNFSTSEVTRQAKSVKLFSVERSEYIPWTQRHQREWCKNCILFHTEVSEFITSSCDMNSHPYIHLGDIVLVRELWKYWGMNAYYSIVCIQLGFSCINEC